MMEDPRDRLDTYDGKTLALELAVVTAMADLVRERGCIVASRSVNRAWDAVIAEHDRTIHRRPDEPEPGSVMTYPGPTPCRMHERMSS